MVADASLRTACALEHPPSLDFRFTAADGSPWMVPVPTNYAANLAFRRRLLDRADADPRVRRALRAMVETPTADGFAFWLFGFGFTYRQNRVLESGKQVSITDGGADVLWLPWPIQIKLAAELIDCIEGGRNVAVDKSRDMGLSWLITAVFVWMTLYRKNVNFLVMSRVEELVDNAEDPDSLFWKIDYLVNALPGWLRPRLHRTRMKLVNTELKSTIVGKSTSAQQGRAGRKTAALFDEAAAMEHFQKIWVSMRHTTPCMIANSTPLGPGFFAKLVRARNVHQLRAPFWDHPLKGRGRYEAVNAETGAIEIRSPWLDRQVAEAVDPLEISQEILMDHQGSGYVVFPDMVLTRQRAKYAVGPFYLGELECTEDADRPAHAAVRRRELDRFVFNDEAADPHWKLWCELVEDDEGRYRPPQNRTYVMGIDIAWGLARANSAIVVKDVETNEQVATYANARIEPAEFARVACMAGHWFGGAHGCAFMCWEANGAGQNFGKGVLGLQYPWVYFNRREDTRARQKEQKYGWHSNPHRKQLLAGVLRSALGRDLMMIRDADILDELADYIFLDSGSVGPADLNDEGAAAKATHGDRAIAAMLAEHASRECFRCKPPERWAPPGSPAFRRRREKERRRADRAPRAITAVLRG